MKYIIDEYGFKCARCMLMRREGILGVIINIEFSIPDQHCRLFKDGHWDAMGLITVIDGDFAKLSVMKRGWVTSEVLLTLDGNPVMFKCGNAMADLLRQYFGSHIYK